jgi:hypothetical protein
MKNMTAVSRASPEKSSTQNEASGIKRYNLSLPEDVFNEIQQIADEQHTTMLEILRRFIKLGLIAYELEKREDAALIIREGDKEREIVLIV